MNELYKVVYRNAEGIVEEEIYLRRVARNKLEDVIKLQRELLNVFINNNASIGPIVANDANWKTMKKLASLIRVYGTDKPGIDIDRLEDDYEQLTLLFFTTCLDDNGEINTQETGWLLKPSLIARLHGLNWEEEIKKIWTTALEEQKKQQLPELEQTTEMPLT